MQAACLITAKQPRADDVVSCSRYNTGICKYLMQQLVLIVAFELLIHDMQVAIKCRHRIESTCRRLHVCNQVNDVFAL